MTSKTAFVKLVFAYLQALTGAWSEIKADAWEMAVAEASGSDRAQSMTKAGVGIVVSLAVAGLVGAFLLPVALDEIVGVDVSNYSSGAQSLWNILDLIIILALFLFFIGVAMKEL